MPAYTVYKQFAYVTFSRVILDSSLSYIKTLVNLNTYRISHRLLSERDTCCSRGAPALLNIKLQGWQRDKTTTTGNTMKLKLFKNDDE